MEYHRQGCSEKRKYEEILSSLLAVRFQKAEWKEPKIQFSLCISLIYAKSK